MSFISLLISLSAALLLLVAAISFLRSKDVFIMAQTVMITNFYIIPLLLVGIAIDRFSLTSFSKIIAVILLNLVVTILLCHATLRRAMINKITPDAEEKFPLL